VFTQGTNIKPMCPNYTFACIASMSRRVGQDRNCHRRLVC